MTNSKNKNKKEESQSQKHYREPVNVSRYVAAASLTILIVLLSVIASNYINNKKMDLFESQEEQIKIDLLSLEVQDLLIEDLDCSFYDDDLFSKEMNDLNSKLTYLEEQNGVNDPQVLYLKKPYTILEMRHFALINKLNKECNKNISTIMYFYSNEGDCDTCDQQGFVLVYLARKYPNLKIYNFDINLDLSLIETIKKIHSLEEKTPILIINGETYYGFKTAQEIEKILGVEND